MDHNFVIFRLLLCVVVFVPRPVFSLSLTDKEDIMEDVDGTHLRSATQGGTEVPLEGCSSMIILYCKTCILYQCLASTPTEATRIAYQRDDESPARRTCSCL